MGILTNKKGSRTAGTVSTANRSKTRPTMRKAIIQHIFQNCKIFFIILVLALLIILYIQDAPYEYSAVEHRVNEGDTLWDIAKQYKPESVSMQEYMAWVYEHNEEGIIFPGDIVIMAKEVDKK